MTHRIRVIRDEHTYLFVFTLNNANKLRRQVGWLAANPEVNFTWKDAANVCHAIRALENKHGQPNI